MASVGFAITSITSFRGVSSFSYVRSPQNNSRSAVLAAKFNFSSLLFAGIPTGASFFINGSFIGYWLLLRRLYGSDQQNTTAPLFAAVSNTTARLS